jgi:hypothetical protein
VSTPIRFGPGNFRGGTGSHLCDWSQVVITVLPVEFPRIICCPQTSGSGSSGSVVVSGSSGSGSGSGSGSVPITTACCPNTFPSTLHATLTPTGCPCAAGTVVTIVWDGVSKWTGSAALGSCGQTITINFYCTGSTVSSFRLDLLLTCGGGGTSGISPFGTPTCAPNIKFELPFGTGAACGCGGPADFVVTVTV